MLDLNSYQERNYNCQNLMNSAAKTETLRCWIIKKVAQISTRVARIYKMVAKTEMMDARNQMQIVRFLLMVKNGKKGGNKDPN